MLDEKLRQVAQRILEDAAFVFVDGGAEDAIELLNGENALSATLEFDGEFSGSMSMSASYSLAKTMAANLLGADDLDPEAESKKTDAIGELLNMVCGNLLPEIAGTSPEFKIGAPRAVSFDETKRQSADIARSNGSLVAMSVEGCEVVMSLLINDESGAGERV
ncbi:MAG TPA: chemotaxis protein CheX [bacterium]|mgnify:CR=1 FL=1|nr:MAG: hypothetical protein BWY28_00022 [bacterium ADurb.Bin236]HOY62308.1 chemotaxis protein CheX [bacterium]HPI75854.1 chemotaxis protein CheX [bacterium]HPN93153.1 chemotaxis protein CheX [bacterium]